MEYPCIVYDLDSLDTVHAANTPYRQTKRYQAVLISKTPKSETFDAIAALPLCAFERRYVAEQLTHDVFNLYF